MNRNTDGRFSMAPQVSIERSKFKRDSSVKTSFNVGEIIPFYLEEVLPGDTFKITTSKIARMQTLKTPMMDDIFLDMYYFYVPLRLVWSHFREFMGENSDSAWIPEAEYTIPQITSPASNGWDVGTIADYLGIRPGVEGLSVNALPFRAYALICDEWFRDENLNDPLVIQFGDSTVAGSNGDTYVTDVAKGGKPYIAAKTHDYFTSALPAPQKGPEVMAPLTNGPLPVHAMPIPNSYYYDPSLPTYEQDDKGVYHNYAAESYYEKLWNSYPLQLDSYPTTTYLYEGWTPPTYWIPVNQNNLNAASSNWEFQHAILYNNGNTKAAFPKGIGEVSGSTGTEEPITNMTIDELKDYVKTKTNLDYVGLTPVNLVAGENDFGLITINELRQAFQIQRFYEKCARGGTRYIEIIKSHFGVTSPDARMQRPEYLGGSRLGLNVRQITQTSSTTENSPLGDVAGMSVTTDRNFDFEKSFTEHGYIIGCCVARYNHTYQQGIERLFNRLTKFDFYWPVFAHLGEQAILNKEIFAQGTDKDSEVFGYQEAWAEYRYKPNRVSGMMRSDANTGLDTWHLGDDYNALPSLSASWIKEDKANVDRVLTVTSALSNQIFADIYVQNETTRPMPLYSIPGLIDHF